MNHSGSAPTAPVPAISITAGSVWDRRLAIFSKFLYKRLSGELSLVLKTAKEYFMIILARTYTSKANKKSAINARTATVSCPIPASDKYSLIFSIVLSPVWVITAISTIRTKHGSDTKNDAFKWYHPKSEKSMKSPILCKNILPFVIKNNLQSYLSPRRILLGCSHYYICGIKLGTKLSKASLYFILCILNDYFL